MEQKHVPPEQKAPPSSVVDPGEAPLFLDQTEARRP